MREYRLGIVVTIFAYVFAGGALVGAYFALKAALAASSQTSGLTFHLIVAACIGVAIYMVKEIQISKFIIAVDRISLVSVIYKRSLALDEIKGWREGKDELHIIPKNDSLKKIRVTTYFKNSDEIREFLGTNYPNLDAADAQAEEDEILNDEAFGADPEERGIRLEQARKAARYTEWFGWGVAAWLFFYPTPYTLCLSAGILYPLLAIAVCFRYRGLIRGEGNKNEKHPSVMGSFIVVSLMLAFRCMKDINTLDYGFGWFLMAIIAVVVFVMYEFSTSRFKFKNKNELVTVFLFPIFTFAYGYGAVTMVNAVGDRSAPTQYQTEVIAKRISNGKSTSYYLELRRWGDLKEDEEISVTRLMYDDTAIGDGMMISQYPGLLGMSWIVVD
ncbi:hypothetical protein WBG78_30280 [Chryseolinea sp. T2]|uniref:hypothetical protein n=1 Tax=Chryseolinea sp. T2 TaxID=3129255 RepID=UPI003077CFB9